MKSIFRILSLTALASAATLSSCNDWLALEPENSVTASKYWQSESDVSAAMTGIYIATMNMKDMMFLHGEMRADNLTPSPNTVNRNYQYIREGNITSSNNFTQWAVYYSVINNCNLLLEFADQALAADPSFTVNACETYKAQATVMRALMYFYLIRTWKDVPYITWAYFDDTTDRNCAPSAQLDILNDLIRQLEEVQASGHLPYSYSNANVAQNKGKVTMYALKALLADMYRLKGSLETDPAASQQAYRSCVVLCDEIIESGQFALIPVPKVAAAEAGGGYLDDARSAADSAFYVIDIASANGFFRQVFADGNSTESIFELQADDYTASTNLYNILVASNRWAVPYRLRMEASVFPSTENELAAAAGYEDVRLTCNSRGMGDNGYCWKYAGTTLDGGYDEVAPAAAEYRRNYIVYRLAEIYLMKAEALVQIAWANDQDQQMLLDAYMALFKVRNRACAVEVTDLSVGGQYLQVQFFNQLRKGEPIALASGQRITCSAMEQFVLDEECREMLFEGRRWFDVLRTAERNLQGEGACTGGGLGYLLNIVADATTVEKATYLRNAYQKPESHYLPYPHQDVLMNDLLSQKPFYGLE